MCEHCNYEELLAAGGIGPTPNRLKVIEIIGNNHLPIGIRDILATMSRTALVNRVTVYRILELFVEKGLVHRFCGWGKKLVYSLAENDNHPAHPHFRCKSCGALHCLQPLDLKAAIRDIDRLAVGEISGVELNVQGICLSCLSEKRKRFTEKGVRRRNNDLRLKQKRKNE